MNMKKGIVLEVHSDYIVVFANEKDIIKAKKNSNVKAGQEVHYKPYKEKNLFRKIASFFLSTL